MRTIKMSHLRLAGSSHCADDRKHQCSNWNVSHLDIRHEVELLDQCTRSSCNEEMRNENPNSWIAGSSAKLTQNTNSDDERKLVGFQPVGIGLAHLRECHFRDSSRQLVAVSCNSWLNRVHRTPVQMDTDAKSAECWSTECIDGTYSEPNSNDRALCGMRNTVFGRQSHTVQIRHRIIGRHRKHREHPRHLYTRNNVDMKSSHAQRPLVDQCTDLWFGSESSVQALQLPKPQPKRQSIALLKEGDNEKNYPKFNMRTKILTFHLNLSFTKISNELDRLIRFWLRVRLYMNFFQ